MGSIRTCLSQVGAVYGADKDLSVKNRHIIWGQ